MRAISCGRCKANLGELASGTKLRTGTMHLCEACGKLIIAYAFKKDGGDFFDLMKDFNSLMGRK